jgi:hypothetical protein
MGRILPGPAQPVQSGAEPVEQVPGGSEQACQHDFNGEDDRDRFHGIAAG